MTKQTRRYTKEFKEGAINLALKSPSLTTTAKELGIPVGTLHTWPGFPEREKSAKKTV